MVFGAWGRGTWQTRIDLIEPDNPKTGSKGGGTHYPLAT
jgi:hypothetical protein